MDDKNDQVSFRAAAAYIRHRAEVSIVAVNSFATGTPFER
jgi:hypothetical protein